MARNGSGTMILTNGVHTGSTTFEQDKDAGTNILASRVDYAMQDMCNALTQSIATDGQSVVTTNIPMGGYKVTNLANGTASTDAATINNLQRQTGIYCGTAGGTATVITLAPSPAISAYQDGMIFNFIPSANSTALTTITIEVNGLAAIPVYSYRDGSTLPANGTFAKMFYAGRLASVMYIGGVFQVLNPFSAWTDWTPTYMTGNVMTFTGVTTSVAKYCVNGNTCFFYIEASGTLGGTASLYLNFSLPFGLSPAASFEFFPAVINQTGVAQPSYSFWTNADNTVRVYTPTTVNWTLGATRYIYVKGFYNMS